MPQLEIKVCGSALTEEDLADTGQALRSVLLGLDVDDVTIPSGGRPVPHAKSAALAAVGVLLVSAAPEMVPAVVDAALNWLKRQLILDVHLEIDGQVLTAQVTRSQRDALVSAFLARVTDDTGQA
ncbi:hypothetical protein [Actinoplanes derwentensis]|uniref:Uncharacterized protein n=1 Tax=Actinoplanes derwentensis TaxID=113562 RepID=A0A1H1VDM7_9ACTN|nr:hypothetical protein [Actinoplanes derwentensis]GID83730.1 hypothetical protein Ade03nite_26540 [Actinoplanes derwentensis]SDS82854.1 hypothetical protein SAMN04489716_1725 [Actinoplanes derwentensis]